MSSHLTSEQISLQDKMAEKPWRVVLLGKTGSGKSSFGNTLMGETKFMVDGSANSRTSKCKAATKSNGEITVIDTPGFFDTRRDEENLKREIIKSIIECSPGPHAFLILLKVEKYTELENQVIQKIIECFSEEAFKYAVLVFTQGDQLDEGMKIKRFVRKNKALKELSEKCGGRCHVVDNKYWNSHQQDPYRNNQFHVTELLNTIKEMVENGGGCYTNEMLQAVERSIEQDEQTAGSREEAKENVFKTLLEKMDGFNTDVWTRAFLGERAAIVKVIAGLGVVGVVGGVVVGAVGGVVVAGAVGGASYLIGRRMRGPADDDVIEEGSHEEGEPNTPETTGESSSKPKKE